MKPLAGSDLTLPRLLRHWPVHLQPLGAMKRPHSDRFVVVHCGSCRGCREACLSSSQMLRQCFCELTERSTAQLHELVVVCKFCWLFCRDRLDCEGHGNCPFPMIRAILESSKPASTTFCQTARGKTFLPSFLALRMLLQISSTGVLG